jgi:predicted PurR-regulated permease PerM
MVAVPILGAELAALIENLPAYVKRVQGLVMDPNHPWVSKLINAGLIEAQRSSDELAKMGASWLTDLLRSLWSDGWALLSIFSLMVVTPIVTGYLVYDWNRMIAVADNSIPLAQRTAVLARESTRKITGYRRARHDRLLFGAYL